MLYLTVRNHGWREEFDVEVDGLAGQHAVVLWRRLRSAGTVLVGDVLDDLLQVVCGNERDRLIDLCQRRHDEIDQVIRVVAECDRCAEADLVLLKAAPEVDFERRVGIVGVVRDSKDRNDVLLLEQIRNLRLRRIVVLLTKVFRALRSAVALTVPTRKIGDTVGFLSKTKKRHH
jgi:hypothetical protein